MTAAGGLNKSVVHMRDLYPCSTLPDTAEKGDTRTVTVNGGTLVMVYDGTEWVKIITMPIYW